jgi:hypothetical protein
MASVLLIINEAVSTVKLVGLVLALLTHADIDGFVLSITVADFIKLKNPTVIGR